MLGAPQGLFYFTGIQSLLSGSFTLSHGVSPSTATLYIPPQTAPLPNIGELTLIYGGVVIRFPQCKILSCDFETANSGQTTWALTIQDARWRWKYGRISGEYNLRRADGDPRPGTLKSPQELAKLLFEAIGVPPSHYDISRLPNNVYPERVWEYARADQELANLCEELGCRVVLTEGNRVTLWPDGMGRSSQLPTGPDVLDNSLAIQPADRPDVLRFVGGRTIWNCDLQLEAVAEDTDGSIKRLNDVSYAPAGGWHTFDLENGQQVKDLKARRLALEWAFKAYRIRTPFKISGESIGPLERVLPIMDRQAVTRFVHGVEEAAPAIVYGQFSPNNGVTRNNVETVTGRVDRNPGELYADTPQIDTDLGIVRFSDPVFRSEFDAAIGGHLRAPADLYLRTGISVRDKNTLAWRHFEKDLPIPGPKTGTKPQCVIHDDVVLKHWVEFSARGYSLANNYSAVQKQAEYYLKAELFRWHDRTPGTITYAGFKSIAPDGAIQQVSWTISDAGEARTRASRGRDEASIALTYKERRFSEQVVGLLEGKKGGTAKKVRR